MKILAQIHTYSPVLQSSAAEIHMMIPKPDKKQPEIHFNYIQPMLPVQNSPTLIQVYSKF